MSENIEKNEENSIKKECNCPKSKICPMGGKCLQTNLIYNAKITTEKNDVYNYIGLCSTTFKARLAVHKMSFKNENSNQTSLSKKILKLQSDRIKYYIQWKEIDRGKPFTPINMVCQLCTKEAYHIIFSPELADLNSKNEIFNSCRHKKAALLCRKTGTTSGDQ